MILSHADILVDVFIGIFSLYTVMYASYSLFWKRKTPTPRPVSILLIFLLGSSLIYLFQTTTEIFTGTTAFVRVWDAYNLLQGVANLIAVQVVTRLTCQNMKDEHADIIKNLPLS